MSEFERRDDNGKLPPGVVRDRRATLPGPEAVQQVKKRIGEILVEEGLVDEEQVETVLSIQKREGGKTVDIMINCGFLDEQKFEHFLGSQPNMAAIALANYNIDDSILKLVPKDFAVERDLFPIDKLGRLLTVGMAYPLDWRSIETLSSVTSLRVKPVLCTRKEVREAITKYYGHEYEEESAASNE